MHKDGVWLFVRLTFLHCGDGPSNGRAEGRAVISNQSIFCQQVMISSSPRNFSQPPAKALGVYISAFHPRQLFTFSTQCLPARDELSTSQYPHDDTVILALGADSFSGDTFFPLRSRNAIPIRLTTNKRNIKRQLHRFDTAIIW